jgi:hypothetical protein
MTPQTYTGVYDAVVESIRRVNPQIKFVGMALEGTSPTVARSVDAPAFVQYFLDRKNHKPGISLDMISYHFYAILTADQTPEIQQYICFEQADRFVDIARNIESIRRRLSPGTRTTIDEIGSIAASDFDQGKPGYAFKPIPTSYWNLSGAVYAYLYAQLARLGIDVAGESQLVGYPSFYPSVSMVDWETGQPNARLWALKLLKDNFSPGDKLVDTGASNPYVFAQAFVTRDGKRKVLLVNKQDREFEISLPGASGSSEEFVDQTTAFQPPASKKLTTDQVLLPGFAVAVVTLAAGS